MTPEEARILAWTILGEAGGEGDFGMTAVAHVIRNRASSGRFSANPAMVAIQSNGRGIYQFSAWNSAGNGGNNPRASYPVGSAPMNKALSIVEKVFGPTPGADPTQGATHYYSPKGMPGGAAPYWWTSEAKMGGKTIGNHIFAIRHQPKEVTLPTPRPMDLGGQAVVINRDPAQVKQVLLPPIAQRSVQGFPTPLPLDLQVERENGGQTPQVTATWVYDPVKKDFVPKTTPGAAPTAKERQLVAGFSVPGGIDGVRTSETVRSLQKQTPTYAKEPAKGVQTVYGPNSKPKDESRLAPGKEPAYPGGARSRDSVAATAAGQATAARLADLQKKVAPVMPTPVQQRPVVVPKPQPQLQIVVQRDSPVADTIRSDPRPMVTTQTGKTVQAGTQFTGTDGYSYRVENDGTITNTKSGSNSGTWYNPDTNKFERR